MTTARLMVCMQLRGVGARCWSNGSGSALRVSSAGASMRNGICTALRVGAVFAQDDCGPMLEDDLCGLQEAERLGCRGRLRADLRSHGLHPRMEVRDGDIHTCRRSRAVNFHYFTGELGVLERLF